MLTRNDFVVEDHHSYFVFSPSDASTPASSHTNNVRTSVTQELTSGLTGVNSVIGEWYVALNSSHTRPPNLIRSCALTPESMTSEADPDGARRDFCIAQKDLYDNVTAGWHFWCMSITFQGLGLY